MATAKTDAQKVTEYRKIAADTKQPQEVRDQADKRASEIEAKSVEAKTGMKLAQGGAVAKAPSKKPAAKKMMYGGMTDKKPMMAKGGAVVAKASAKKAKK